MSKQKLKVQMPGWPAALIRIGDKVVYWQTVSTTRQAKVVSLGTLIIGQEETADVAVMPVGGDVAVSVPFKHFAAIFPPSRELRIFDPRGRLRKYAAKYKLRIARAYILGDVPVYKLVEPLSDYETVSLFISQQQWPLVFSGGTFIRQASGDFASQMVAVAGDYEYGELPVGLRL